MMSVGIRPIAGMLDHGGHNYQHNYTHTYGSHDQPDLHPGNHRDALRSARAGCVGRVSLADTWWRP